MRAFLGLLLALTPLFADGIPRDEYRSRRAELRKSMEGIMVLFGANENEEDLPPALRQETNFLYLTGWKEPGAAVMLTKTDEILFLPERQPPRRDLLGRRLAPDDADAARKTIR